MCRTPVHFVCASRVSLCACFCACLCVRCAGAWAGAWAVQVQPHERETAGFVLSFFLQLGILLGSQVALGVAKAN